MNKKVKTFDVECGSAAIFLDSTFNIFALARWSDEWSRKTGDRDIDIWIMNWIGVAASD